MKGTPNNVFEHGLSPVQQRLFSALLVRLKREFAAYTGDNDHTDRGPSIQAIAFLQSRIREELQSLEALRSRFAQFTASLNAAPESEDQRHLILDLSRDLGASADELKKDSAAFDRWFGPDAMVDRCQLRRSTHEQYVSFLLDRLGTLAAHALSATNGNVEQTAFWHSLALEDLLKPLFTHEGDPRVRVAAFRCLASVLIAMNPALQERAVDDTTLQFIYRSALKSQQNVWIQCAALELLVTLSWSSFQRALEQRLLNPAAGDDLFLRRRAVELLSRHFRELESGTRLLSAVLLDPSPFVRQAVPLVLTQAPVALALDAARTLLAGDPSPQVRAAMWLQLPALLANPEAREGALLLFSSIGREEKDDFVLRVLCLVAERAAAALAAVQDPFLRVWHECASAVLLELRCSAASIRVRRWASQALEFLWTECDPQTRSLRQRFTEFARSIPRGKTRRVPGTLSDGLPPAYLARIWSVVCRHDYDLQLRSTRGGLRVTRGHVFGFRWWRWWYEFRHPSPDKRQAFQHTIGRLFDGQIQVPSAILAELAQTKVPGEPLQISDEGGWRPYLPLLDQLTSCIELGRIPQPVQIFTSEGVTTVTPPTGWTRVQANLKLVFHFREYADKRNWLASMQEDPSAYLQALQQLGFQIRFEPHRNRDGSMLPADPMVERFFPGLVFSGLLEAWDRFHDYFISLYQNSIPELALFTAGFCALFFAVHLFFNGRLKYWRKRIPLVIGGWGTRGKSGTERLKAALFNALGLGVVSKTTGCEAMFLHAHPFGEMKEMFLFRPYDKATIWEQVNVVRIAGRLKTDVMLWECMGLTPAYVRILQRSWMRDQFSTITNTYPDHEDLQGPAGINIPEVIGCFIPENSTLVTSEEQMLPILATEAEQRKTALQPVTWLDAGLIPVDILQRFPYEEHPYNIALVLGLAAQLKIPRDFVLKEMADRVVPDLGVLKTYPVATRRTRRLEFTNGMSANERFGTVSNWARTGFDKQDFLKEPGVWLTTVVNNRADRVPRSQVFARVLVNDLSADRHVLIGGNLNGLQGYIREAWAEKAPQISLWKNTSLGTPAEALQVLEEQALLMRLPVRPELIQAHLRIMLSAQPAVTNVDHLVSLWEKPDALKAELAPLQLGEIQTAILSNLEHELRILNEYRAFAAQLREAQRGQEDALNTRFRDLLGQWFHSKIIVVEDYYATGDQIIELITRHTPPGFLNRVMGIQNIKGTGLDFVYRWQAWQACHNAAAPLRPDNIVLNAQMVSRLAAFQDYGVLCEEFVRDTVARIQNSKTRQPAQVYSELEGIVRRLDAAMKRIEQKANSGGARSDGWWTTVLLRLEEFLDAGDAVRRRSQADRIYEDLIAQRISRERAVAELQALTQRQKGGWLPKKLAKFRMKTAKTRLPDSHELAPQT